MLTQSTLARSPMLRKFKIQLARHKDTISKIARDYGCSKQAVWRELCGEGISEPLRRFIARRWGVAYERLWKVSAREKIERGSRRAA